MKCSFFRPLRYMHFFLGLMLVCTSSSAQKASLQSSKPIDLDRELEGQVAPDRAISYYHYSLAKWYEDQGDLSKAFSEMQNALRYNQNSPAVHLEMAVLLEKAGNVREAIEHAEEAIRLNPRDPDPHWFLANIYFKPQERGKPAAEGVQKAVQELEKLQELTPQDERIYYALGEAYFGLNEPEKAIQAYEKFQSLSSETDAGYRAIAQYYYRTGKEEKAIEYLTKGLRIQPDSVESLQLLNLLYSKLGKNKEAISEYKKLLELSGNSKAISQLLAKSLVEAGEYGEAVKILNDLVKAAPKERDTQILLGRAQIGLRDFSEAIKTLQLVIEADPDAIEAQFYLGKAYEDSGRYGEAAKLFSNLLSNASSGSEEARANLVVFQQHLAADYMELGDHEKGIAIYQEMAKADPKATAQLMDAYRVSRQFDKAIALGKRQYESNPGDVQTGIVYALSLADADRPKEGAEILTKLLQSNPENVDLYINLSRVYVHDKRYSDAKEILRRAEDKKLDSENNERLKFQLAAVYERQKEYDRAAEVLSNLLQSNPQNLDIYINLSQLYLQDKRFSDAKEILRRAEDKKLDGETNERLKYHMAAIYERQKDFDRAESLLKEVLKVNPKNADALNYIGYMLADRGVRLEEALEYVREALAIYPRNGAYLDSLGWAFFKLNDLENAEKYLLKADEAVKDDPTIDEHLGDLYFKIGNLEKAQDFWMKSVKIGTESEDIQKVRRKLEMLQETLRKQKSGK